MFGQFQFRMGCGIKEFLIRTHETSEKLRGFIQNEEFAGHAFFAFGNQQGTACIDGGGQLRFFKGIPDFDIVDYAVECAVGLFLEDKIRFVEIFDYVIKAYESIKPVMNPTVEEIEQADRQAREEVLSVSGQR